MGKVIVLSGGLDSTVMLYQCLALASAESLQALSFNYGSKHNEQEINYASKTCIKLGITHKIIHLKFINELFKSDLLQNGGKIPKGHYEHESMKKTVVPFRNGIMLSIAAGIADSVNANTICIGAHDGDHAIYKDCRDSFMHPIARAIREGTENQVTLEVPFLEMRKHDIVLLGQKLKVPFQDTYSCYEGEEKHCGTCGTCNERIESFTLANVIDPTEYKTERPL